MAGEYTGRPAHGVISSGRYFIDAHLPKEAPVPVDDSREPFRVFVSYSHLDEKYLQKDSLFGHLRGLENDGVDFWYDRDIETGALWDEAIKTKIAESHLALVLVSQAFLDSAYCQNEEIPRFLAQELPIVAVLLSPCEWGRAKWLAERQFRPRDGQTVEEHFTVPGKRKRLWFEVRRDIRGHLETWQRDRGLTPGRRGNIMAGQRIHPSKLIHVPDRLFGRESDLARLDAAWDDPTVHILTVVAWGGVGKTSLVAHWADGLVDDDGVRFGGADYFDWSFYSQGTREQGSASSDVFLDEALRFFGDTATADSAGSPSTKGARLAALLAERRALLVLDGLEPLQHPPGPLAGELKDAGIKALFRGLATQNAGLCVVTTRERVEDLGRWRETWAPEWSLSKLSVDAGCALLGFLGVHGKRADLEAAVHEVDGHALTLRLLALYLARAHRGDVRRRDRVRFTEADRRVQGGHAFRAMEAYARWLADREKGKEDGERQLAVLHVMGLFDRPASPECLKALRSSPMIEGLTEPLVDLSGEDWRWVLDELAACGLLTVEGELGSLWVDAHPLVREYFGKRLREGRPGAWREAHGRLFEYLTESTEHRPEDLEGLQPLYQAVVHGCLAGRVEEARAEVYRDRISRGAEAYVVHKLGAFGADLGAVSCFFERPWSVVSSALSEDAQAWLLHQAAFRLRAVGRLREAVEPMRVGLGKLTEQESWEQAAASASNLSELELTLGDVSASVEYAERSVEFADRSGAWDQRMKRRTTLGDALHQAGRLDESFAHFEEAESLQAEEQPTYPLLYSLRGFRYCDALLAEVESAAWEVTAARLRPARDVMDQRVNSFTRSAEAPRERGKENQGEQGEQKKQVVKTTRCDIPSSRTRTNTDEPGPMQPDIPVLYSSLLDACNAVDERALQLIKWHLPSDPILDIALDHLTLGRVRLYRSILENTDPSAATPAIETAVEGLRNTGDLPRLPPGLLTRAWLHTLQNNPNAAQTDLDEAHDIAERGPMPLFLADIALHRARLFGDPDALAEARRLIEKHGYGRRRA